MTLVALALVLSSAAIHATWNLWAKQIGGDARSVPLIWMLTAVSTVLYAPFAAWSLTHGTWRPDGAALAWIAGSGAIHIGYFVFLLRGYRASDLSLVYPAARGSGPLLAALGAVALFHEQPTALSVAGAVLISIGVGTLALGSDLARTPHLRAGLAWGLLTGISIAAYTLWDGWSVKRVGVPPLVFYWGGEVTRVLLMTPVVLGQRSGVARLWRDHRARVLGIAALSPLSYILILIALRTGRVSHIAPAREISILIGAQLGSRVLGESHRARRSIAAGAFVAGVFALAVG